MRTVLKLEIPNVHEYDSMTLTKLRSGLRGLRGLRACHCNAVKLPDLPGWGRTVSRVAQSSARTRQCFLQMLAADGYGSNPGNAGVERIA